MIIGAIAFDGVRDRRYSREQREEERSELHSALRKQLLNEGNAARWVLTRSYRRPLMRPS